MDLVGHWLATPPDPEPETAPISVISGLTVAGLRANGWTVEGPFVPAEQLKGAVAERDRLQELIGWAIHAIEEDEDPIYVADQMNRRRIDAISGGQYD
jgi:hypothetical protein